MKPPGTGQGQASTATQIVDVLSSLTLFADLARPQLEATVHSFDEQWFNEGERVLRQGFAGSGFYIILEGEAQVRIDGRDWNKLSRGDFFGEISILLGERPSADVVALGPLRCLVISEPEFEAFLDTHPQVMYRMLQTMARRLRSATQGQS